jgi:large subunit ribosomal protein L10e
MAALRKASAYSKKKVRPYTRKSSVKAKSFIKAVPQNKIVKFNMGNNKDLITNKYKYRVTMIAEEKAQIRDNALEACRMSVNKVLDLKIPGGFYFKVKVFPHHIQRENKIAAGAGADRLSSGMTRSFGVTIGRAALMKPGNELFEVLCLDENGARVARDALIQVKSKIPCRNRIIFEKIQ